MKLIVSEDAAEKVGRTLTGGERDKDFVVFHYKDDASKLTVFGVEIAKTGNIVRRN
jgi:hypothetical protein